MRVRCEACGKVRSPSDHRITQFLHPSALNPKPRDLNFVGQAQMLTPKVPALGSGSWVLLNDLAKCLSRRFLLLQVPGLNPTPNNPAPQTTPCQLAVKKSQAQGDPPGNPGHSFFDWRAPRFTAGVHVWFKARGVS